MSDRREQVARERIWVREGTMWGVPIHGGVGYVRADLAETDERPNLEWKRALFTLPDVAAILEAEAERLGNAPHNARDWRQIASLTAAARFLRSHTTGES